MESNLLLCNCMQEVFLWFEFPLFFLVVLLNI
ncbi:hypothetical protein sync_2578 [Synechococcus sp. CC9311]|nr:hypothetical protein sync_2578 [Synechococcus sp. CC9311]